MVTEKERWRFPRGCSQEDRSDLAEGGLPGAVLVGFTCWDDSATAPTRTAIFPDPQDVFAGYVDRAQQFAAEMTDLASIHRKAVLADWQEADILLKALRRRLDLVTQHLPAPELDA
ncbi:hypothetical protein [Streptomyces nojiriensis]|uniref:hypothetical protein n=1 Tax=Streptomyces nojiriensis TaxID=66374 RepID=UPI00365880F2